MTASTVTGVSHGPSRSSALARTIAGCALSSMRPSSAPRAPGAPAVPSRAARRRNSGSSSAPCRSTSRMASAAHCGVCLRVAVVAGVRHAEPGRDVGPRNAHRVIVPRVDDHVRRRRHVARRAGGAPACRSAWCVCAGASYFAGRWHCAQTALPGGSQLQRVRLVAVRAGDALPRASCSARTSPSCRPRRASGRRSRTGRRRAAPSRCVSSGGLPWT